MTTQERIAIVISIVAILISLANMWKIGVFDYCFGG